VTTLKGRNGKMAKLCRILKKRECTSECVTQRKIVKAVTFGLSPEDQAGHIKMGKSTLSSG